MKIENAKNSRKDVIRLLQEQRLPVSDLPESLDNFLVARNKDLVIGTGGLEIYGAYALLRSMAVDTGFRRMGIASELLQSIESLAHSTGVQTIYLLTETATDYFKNKGYLQISRSDVPDEIQSSSEFSHVCPQSAIVMSKNLIP